MVLVRRPDDFLRVRVVDSKRNERNGTIRAARQSGSENRLGRLAVIGRDSGISDTDPGARSDRSRRELPRIRDRGIERSMAYWLFKSEPKAYSFAGLARRARSDDGLGRRAELPGAELPPRPGRRSATACCSTTPTPTRRASRGSPRSSGRAIPIPTAFDPKSDHHDPKSDPDNPTWYQVSIKAVRAIEPPLGLPELERHPRAGRDGAAAQGEPAVGPAGDEGRVGYDPEAGPIEVVDDESRTARCIRTSIESWNHGRRSSISRSMPTTRRPSRTSTSGPSACA